jgi:hypothetical protein
MYIPFELFFATVTLAIAYFTYTLGRRDDESYRQEIVDATIEYLISENMVLYKRRADGEVELFPLDEK